ncbi:ester cyclase [Shumkonia mesophila]|uniref:ester cyclase n=1 Tax=Shumkonia mesophila TaxID=2838854 RepID=UPI0029346CC2|nr:ester cyclase [Shumkonia mesophila]
MTPDELREIYRGYIDCLNRQDWDRLGMFVDDAVEYNGTPVGLTGYRGMLEGDFRAIPDLHFGIELLISDPPRIASRLHFDCTPRGMLFDLPVNGKRIKFEENVFYEFSARRVRKVWSIIDKAAIAQQV